MKKMNAALAYPGSFNGASCSGENFASIAPRRARFYECVALASNSGINPGKDQILLRLYKDCDKIS
jgi:hypothetical protein